MKSTAILLGATGLIGGHILDALKSDVSFDTIKVIVRRPFKVDHPKVKVEVIDFEDANQFELAMQGGDVIFSAIGTTQKKVKGDKEKYRKIDFDITVNAAKFGSKGGCKQFLVVSSVGADSSKSGFYLKLKGEVEDALIDLSQKEDGIESLSIFRPSLLLGERSETRIAESIGQFFSKALSFLFPKNMKPIKGKTVAQAMVEEAKLNKKGVEVYYYQEMKDLCS
jgi:uncharacterized protein YbjT (DUF2867 family)